jgi:hypothetical protein
MKPREAWRIVRLLVGGVLLASGLTTTLVLTWLDYRGALALAWFDILSPLIVMALVAGVLFVIARSWGVVSETLRETAEREREVLR